MAVASSATRSASGFSRLFSYGVLACLLLFTVYLWRSWNTIHNEIEQNRYSEYTDSIASTVTKRLHDYEMVLKGAAGLFIASEGVTRDEWRAYSGYQRVHTSFPDIQGLGFNAVVLPSELASHVQSIREEGFPDYTVWPEGKRDVYTPIVFLEPVDARNRRALGYDTFSDPVRRAAMERARDTGEVSISGKVTLVQETGKDVQTGFLMFVPVFAASMPVNTPEERQGALKGYVSAAFRMNDFMQGILPYVVQGIEFEICDGRVVSESGVMYVSDGRRGSLNEQRTPIFSSRETVALFGHHWTFDFRTKPTFEADFDQKTSWGILMAGLAISLLAYLFIRSLENTRQRAFALAREMTSALRQSEDRYRILADNLPVGVAIIGPDMKILATNTRLHEWFPESDAQQHVITCGVFHTPPRSEPCESCPVPMAFQDGKAHTVDMEFNTSQGIRRFFITAVPLIGPDGEVSSVHETLEDITEREQTQRKLRENERKYRELVENANSIILYWTDDGQITFLNEFGQRFFGYSESEILGRNIIGTIVPETESTGRDLRPLIDQISTDPAAFEHNVNENIRRNGETVWIAWTNKVAFDSHGQVEGILSIGTDITERRRTESALRESEARYRGLFEDCPTSFWEEDFSEVKAYLDELRRSGVTDLDAHFNACPESLRQCAKMVRVLDVNRATLDLLEYERREDLCAHLSQVFRDESYRLFQEELVCLASGKNVFQSEAVNRNRRGEKLHVNMTVAIVPGHEQTWSRVFVSISDISSRVRMEEGLRESEARFRSYFNLPLQGIAIVSPDKKWIQVNDRIGSIFGYPREEIMCMTWEEITFPDDLPASTEKFDALLAGQIEQYAIEKRYIRKDGAVIWADLAVGCVRKSDGSVDYVVEVLDDITERKQAEQHRIAREAAEEASRAKGAFVANMSHEIRTPLNAILGFAQVLERDPSLGPRQAEHVRVIGRSGEHLLQLINEILDMSKIEAGRATLNEVAFSLHDLLDDLDMMFRSRATAKGLQLVSERDESVPRCAFADEGKLRQILVNLMGNAIKFTGTGGVAVRVHVETIGEEDMRNERSLRLLADVEDTGPGIPDEDMDRIFEAFHQAGTGVKAGGTGLGLAICREFVKMMGGELTVKSRVNQGTCFRLDVPLKPSEDTAVRERAVSRRVAGLESGAGPFRVLVVDDVPNNRALMCELLRPVGFEVAEAGNGVEALEIFERCSPQAVFMDLRMPVMDGYEAIRRLKSTEAGRAASIIAITASAFDDYRDMVLATGADAYMRKPFRPEELFEVLGKCLGLRYVLHDETDSPNHRDLPPATQETLTALPIDLIQAMRQAVTEGDVARLTALIDQVACIDGSIASGLQALADQYDYEKLIAWLEREG